MSSKKKTQKNLHPLVDAGGNRGTEDKKKAEVINALFTLFFNSKTSCVLGTQFLSLKTGTRSRIKPTLSKG